MLCQNCKSAEASSHIHSVVNGVVTDAYLCSECAKKLNKSFSNDDIFGLFSSFFKENTIPNVKAVACECCGSTFDDISKNGKVGCACCYKTFFKQLEPALIRLHGRSTHIGKRLINIDIAAKTDSDNKINEIDDLKNRLKIAIDNEEYEKAAVLRDEIKEKSGEK